jgi:Peptidase family M28
MSSKVPIAFFAAVLVAAAQRGVPSDWQAVMNRIRPDSVRGHLSFLASDVLEGRGTPSRGLDVAAEYIASQFRRAGLEPAFATSYFQPLDLREAAIDMDGFECRIYERGGEVSVTGIPLSKDGIQVDREPILPAKLTSFGTSGAVAVFRGDGTGPEVLKQLAANDAKLVIVVDPTGRLARSALRIPVVPADREPKVRDGRWLFVTSFPDNLSPDARITVKAKPVSIRPLSAKNVAGLLRGSDPALRDTYLVVSAHYDHEGMRPFGSGDRIFNGANDNASGVTGVLEMAASFAQLPERPKRSVLFVTFAAEEDGLYGSREFVRNPPVGLTKIVADVNFEHLGRPDADGTSYVGKGSMTGIDFSTIGPSIIAAGRLTGIEFIKHEKYNEQFFAASDNLSFAQRGIPSLTVCNGFLFPEYHAPGDHWEKIDVDNMTGLVRALALGVLTIADDARAPRWNESNEKTLEFRKSAGR